MLTLRKIIAFPFFVAMIATMAVAIFAGVVCELIGGKK